MQSLKKCPDCGTYLKCDWRSETQYCPKCREHEEMERILDEQYENGCFSDSPTLERWPAQGKDGGGVI